MQIANMADTMTLPPTLGAVPVYASTPDGVPEPAEPPDGAIFLQPGPGQATVVVLDDESPDPEPESGVVFAAPESGDEPPEPEPEPEPVGAWICPSEICVTWLPLAELAPAPGLGAELPEPPFDAGVGVAADPEGEPAPPVSSQPHGSVIV